MESQRTVHFHAWTTEVLTYLLLTLGLILVLKYLLRSNVPANIPPFPAKAYPILGHLPYLRTGISKKLEEWRKQTGEIFSLYFGSGLVVILSNYDLAYEAFVSHGDTLSDRPDFLSVNTANEEAKLGILMSSGPLWKEQRTAVMQILRSLGVGKNTLAEKVNEEVSAFMEALTHLSEKPIYVHTLINRAVSNVICSIIMGKRFEYDDAYFVQFLHMMNEQSELTTSNSMFSTFPWLRHLPGDLFKAKRRIENEKNIMAFFCDHYIEKSEKEFDENEVNNFIDAYLLRIKNEERHENHTTLDKKNLRRDVFDLFGAGTETTTGAMMWFLANMLQHPHTQEKIYREIAENVGTERAVTILDREHLNYTYAAVMESMRLSSLGTLGPPHIATEDTMLRGYTIPAGTTLMVNFDAVQWNCDNFKYPKEFKPERFLDAEGKFTQPKTFSMFGVGRRRCPGEPLARMELFLFLSAIIQRFELQPAVPGQIPCIEARPGILTPPKPFKIRFADRRNK